VRRPLPPLALAYHGVATVPWREDRWRLFVTPRQIVRDVKRLRGWGYELVTFGALARHVRDGTAAGRAALTFDDGLADNLETLAPLLDRLSAPATTFVVTSWLGGTHADAPAHRMLNAAQVHDLASAGIEIGAHTHGHDDLTTLADAAIEDEWRRSQDVLEDLIGAPVTVGAYPFGRSDQRVRAATARAGLDAVCRTSGAGSWSDLLDLPRQAMGHGSSAIGLRFKRDDRYEALLRAPGATRVRRVSRWTRSALDRWRGPLATEPDPARRPPVPASPPG
jgi:hypothetical protein